MSREAGRSRARIRAIATEDRREQPKSRSTARDAIRLGARRAHVERRLRFLEREERRFARSGFSEEATEAARERRYWEFVRTLLAGSPAALETPTTVH